MKKTNLQFVEFRKGLYWSAVAGAMRRYDIQAITHGNWMYCLYDAQSADVLWSGKNKTLLQAKRACMEHFASMPMDDVGDVGLFC